LPSVCVCPSLHISPIFFVRRLMKSRCCLYVFPPVVSRERTVCVYVPPIFCALHVVPKESRTLALPRTSC
jgi:hypothetical protein